MNSKATCDVMDPLQRESVLERRRRVCSVVAPKLAVEHTKNGARTVVIDYGNARAREDKNSASCSINHKVTTCNSECRLSTVCSTTATSQTIGLKRHQSLPKRFRPVFKKDTVLQNKRRSSQATCSSRVMDGEKIHKQRVPSPALVPLNDQGQLPPVLSMESVHSSHVNGRNQTAVDKRPVRKTQRSISAHSAALPAPDSSILRDGVTGKIYKRGKLLGKGGFAKVHEGQEVSSGRKYALKIFHKSRLSYPQQRDKMETEIEMHVAASEAGHPNVAKFETMFENPRMLCLVLELCEKRSLAQYLRRSGFLSEAEVSDLLWQIVCGLAHIHGCGILHRDLKLGNILLSGDTAKIGDFGLATEVSWRKRKSVCGTPNFIAPEVLQRQGHSSEADVWSLGCILYTMLVGKPPFESTSLKDTYKCILKNSYVLPSSVSTEAADLIQWMLSPKPHSRPTLRDVLNHVFFIKHQTHTRFPSIDDLSKEFPCKIIAPDCHIPQRRRSAGPVQTFHVDESYSVCNATGLEKTRSSSYPVDTCTHAAITRNDPSCSIGPKISILEHMKQVQTSSKSTETLTKDKPEELCDTDLNASLAKAATMTCAVEHTETELAPQLDPAQSQVFEQTHDSKKWQSARDELKIPSKSKLDNVVRKRAKYSPIKMLASKLQKFKILSPNSCMKAALKARSKDQGNNGISPNAGTPNMITEPTWITKWVDYSNKYGFGYQLANGRICVLFNNGAHIALMPDEKTIEYIEPDGTPFGSKTIFNMQAPLAAHEHATKILQFFVSYMDKNLRRGSTESTPETDSSLLDSVRMLTWSRTTDRVAMYLSNGTLQVNFCDDHTKINVSNIHENTDMKVTFVDKDRESSAYGRDQLRNSQESEPRRRLEEAHKEFHHLLEKEHCISHPFCAIFDAVVEPLPAVQRIDATAVAMT